MLKNKKFHYFEIGLYVFIGIISIVIPIFMHLYEGTINWNLVYLKWIRLIPFLLIFLVNNFILSPKLLFRSKYPAYILSCFVLLICIAFADSAFMESRKRNREKALMEELSQINGCEHTLLKTEKVDSTHLACSQTKMEEKSFLQKIPIHNKRLFFCFSILSIGLLIIGFNSGVKIFVYWSTEREERNEKERHYLTTELAYLKQQVSPHFFMNTLNNIHALIDINADQAKDAIVKLSRLMRYLLYEVEAEKILLSKELEFMESYIELMRLRYDEAKLSIKITYSKEAQSVYVPSLLFLPLVENAFKHGVSNKSKSFVDIDFKTKDNMLVFNIINSNFPKISTGFNETSGIGLENICKRLNLIYGDNYVLTICPNDEIFDVSLSIPKS
ncbi:MAG: histidine kinase [Bacteroidales bacterium]|nr:histidine kinase [Bacteroidales bacterium]